MHARPKKPAAMAALQAANYPAPTGGLNTSVAGAALPAEDCIQLYNMIAAEYGVRSRLGSREWATGLTGAANNQVRTVFYYHGSAANGSKDRVFVTTSRGIYDVTASVATTSTAWSFPTLYAVDDMVTNGGNIYICVTSGTSDDPGPSGTGAGIVDGGAIWDFVVADPFKLAFSSSASDAGRGVFHSFTTTGGHFCAYTDEENGYHLYTESTDTWAVGSVDNVAEADLVFVGSWKHRLWFAEKDTASAWYLDLASIAGPAVKLDLEWAAKPRNGGDLVGIYNWTLDGGIGIDDHLVFVFRGGDIAIYQGTDPEDATKFSLKGVWYAGAIPAGRNVVTPYGGDLLILTKNGVRPLSLLVSGGDGVGQYATKKISNLFNSLMLTKASIHGWAMHIHPEDNALVVTHPTTDGANTEQLVMSLVNGSWSRYRDLPMYSAGAGGGKLYFGSVDGKVYINDGYVDGITLDDPNAYAAVQWALLTGFRNFGNSRIKRVQMMKPTILSENTTPEYRAEARYNYNFTEVASVAGGTVTSDEWDGGVWDTTTWGGEFAAAHAPTGATGIGVDVALAIRGTATSRTVFVGADVFYDEGGAL